MKRMSDVFDLPVSYVDAAELTVNLSVSEVEYVQRAINNVDALADALEGLLNRLHYEGCDFADMAVAGTALARYRGEA